MDRIDEGYQWLEGIADRMKEEIGRGVAASPESLKVREPLWQFGFQRRGDWIIPEGPGGSYVRKDGYCRYFWGKQTSLQLEQLTLNVDAKLARYSSSRGLHLRTMKYANDVSTQPGCTKAPASIPTGWARRRQAVRQELRDK